MATFNLFDTLRNDLTIDTIERTVSVVPQLAKKDYAKVKSIFNRLGGAWNSQKQHFQFTKCPQALIERVLSVGSRRLNKFHFYPTPVEIFDYMTRFTPLSYFGACQKSVRVLEPSSGEGSLIRQLQAFGDQESRHFDIDGYDIDPLNVLFCREAGLNVQQADFLTIDPAMDYELLLMNPPFAGDAFITHIKHAQKFLKASGLLISVVPTQWITTFNGSAMRSWLLEQAQIDSASDLDENNFFEPGTFKGVSVATTVICLRSCQSAERTLNSEHYRSTSIDAFKFFIDNHSTYWNKLHCLKMAEKSAGETVVSVENMVASILQNTSSDTTHLVRRCEAAYVLALVEDWFPEYAYKLRKAPPEPQQLDLAPAWAIAARP